MSRKISLIKIEFLIILMALGLCLLKSGRAHADEYHSGLLKPTHPNQSIMIENTNFTLKNYISASMSSSLEERRYSEMYLLGVLDATEGVIWCDYRTYKTISIIDILFSELNKSSGDHPNERASTIIKNILKKEFPCKIKSGSPIRSN